MPELNEKKTVKFTVEFRFFLRKKYYVYSKSKYRAKNSI